MIFVNLSFILFIFFCLYFLLKDPEIRSLPASNSLHKDTDEEAWLHDLVVYDYNYYWEDNNTCHVKYVYDIWDENDQQLFELRQDDQSNLYSWNCKNMTNVEIVLFTNKYYIKTTLHWM